MLFFTRRLVKTLSSSLDEFFEKQTNIQLASKSATISDEANSAYTQFEHDSAIQGKILMLNLMLMKNSLPGVIHQYWLMILKYFYYLKKK